MADDKEKKDKDQSEEEVKPETTDVSSNNPDISGKAGSTGGGGGQNLDFEVTGGGKKIGDHVEIDDFKNDGESGGKNDGTPDKIDPEKQPGVASEMDSDKQKDNKPGQPPAADPNAPNPQESAPLVPDENLDKDAPSAQPKPPTDGPDDSSQGTDQPPEGEQGQPGQDGADPSQNKQQQIAADVEKWRQQRKINEIKQAEAELKELSKDADDTTESAEVSIVIKTFLPPIASEINDVFAELKQIKGPRQSTAIRKNLKRFQELKGKLDISRIMVALTEGTITWWSHLFLTWGLVLLLWPFYIIYALMFGVLPSSLKKVIDQIEKVTKKLQSKLYREQRKEALRNQISF